MRCRKPDEGRLCRQITCVNAAVCLTEISGFPVYACAEHHCCDRKRKEAKP